MGLLEIVVGVAFGLFAAVGIVTTALFVFVAANMPERENNE